MALSVASRRAQRGVALLAMVAVVVMGVAYMLVDRLHAASRFIAVDRAHNAKVLSRAKQALVGWMAINAATDNNPGRLPCPEAVNAIGTDSEGIAAPLVTPSTPNCATVGRLPWRTLGLDKLVDANAEPLWYVVSPGWALQNSSTLLTIYSDSRGNMVIDGQAAPNEVVAMIIAPGPAMNVQAATGCTARAQARAAATPAMDPLDYIECFNTATPAFSTTGPATSFNDQVVRVTVGDLVPALEAAIADRAQREIAPALRAVYTSAQYSGIPSSSPLYPYATPFTNPGNSSYVGAAGTYQGLLPFNQTQGCVVGTDPRCQLLTITGNPRPPSNGSIYSISCSTASTERLCWGRYSEDSVNPSLPIYLEMNATFRDVAMGLRALDANLITRVHIEATNKNGSEPWVQLLPTNLNVSAIRMNSGSYTYPDGVTPPGGSVTITFGATLPNIDSKGWGWEADFRMWIERTAIGDHALLNPTHASLGWFVRNEWFRLLYYAAAQDNTAAGLPTLGCSSSTCLRINDPATRNIRALLILAGRSLTNPAGRPNAILSDYVEFQNADLGTLYEQRPMRMSKVAVSTPFYAPWNDRVVLVDWDSASPPNAVQVVDPANLTALRVAAARP